MAAHEVIKHKGSLSLLIVPEIVGGIGLAKLQCGLILGRGIAVDLGPRYWLWVDVINFRVDVLCLCPGGMAPKPLVLTVVVCQGPVAWFGVGISAV